MNTLVVDAYDSFVYIIVQYLAELEAGPVVRRHDAVTVGQVEELAPDAIVLGPGPGHPSEAGYVELVRQFAGRVPILGVCLGHQAVGLAFGGTVGRAANLMHGKTSRIRHDGRGCFTGVPDDFEATRYHSLIVDGVDPAGGLEVSATAADDGYVMGLRHRELPVESVQFHPESYRTDRGILVFRNFLRHQVGRLAQTG